MTKPWSDQVLKLPGGRKLAYAQYGTPDGTPLFHFHGGGSSRLEGAVFCQAAAKLGIRLIAVDRPGVGGSELQSERRLLDWPDDVVELANALGIERFAVQGISGGAPYALACAFKIPHRLTACGVISGMVPVNLISSDLPWRFRLVYQSRRFPRLFGAITKLIYRLCRSEKQAKRLFQRSIKSFSGPDRRLFDNPEMQRLLLSAVLAGTSAGAAGGIAEAMIGVSPWGFDLSALPGQRIFIWHGLEDNIVPAAAARLVSNAIPNCSATFLPAEGHYSLAINRAEAILSTLAALD